MQGTSVVGIVHFLLGRHSLSRKGKSPFVNMYPSLHLYLKYELEVIVQILKHSTNYYLRNLMEYKYLVDLLTAKAIFDVTFKLKSHL